MSTEDREKGLLFAPHLQSEQNCFAILTEQPVETQPIRLRILLVLPLALVPGVLKASSSQAGADAYRQYCAVCHGLRGTGDGPVADALRVKPADLTRLRSNNHGRFPALHILSYIRGDDAVQAHGTREMPVWGRIFLDESGGRPELVQMRIYSLLKYIETLQVP